MRPYSLAEVRRFMRDYGAAESVAALARDMGRTPKQLRSLARALGVVRLPKPKPAPKPPRMSASEREALIRKHYSTAETLEPLAARLGLKESSLRQYAHLLGVRRDPALAEAARLRGVAASAKVRRAKAERRGARATPLDAAWRGLQP